MSNTPGLVSAETARAQARELFQAVLDALKASGWVRERVDTLVRDGETHRDRWTIRHHHVAGEWTFYREQDRRFISSRAAERGAQVKFGSGPLPTVDTILHELL